MAVLYCALLAFDSSGRLPVMFDVVILGGSVVDGTGAPAYRADVGIKGETIAEIW